MNCSWVFCCLEGGASVSNDPSLVLDLGGMQDWNYLHTNCFEVTIELGCVKYPNAEELPKYWKENRRSLLQFMKQVRGCSHPKHTCSSVKCHMEPAKESE